VPLCAKADASATRRRLDVADGDGRGGVTAGLLGRSCQISERGVGDVIGVQVEGVRVVGFQPFHEVLGRECAAADGASIDAGGLVDLVAKCGDLGPPARCDLIDVEVGSPVKPETQDDVLRPQVTPGSDTADRVAERPGSGDARASGR
jgi:hypothetical protein